MIKCLNISKTFLSLLGIFVVTLILILTLFSTKVYAASIPTGGTAIDSAVTITAGTYTVGALTAEEEMYYSISLKAGQELVVTGTFQVAEEYHDYGTNNAINIYDENKVAIVEEYESAGTLMTASTLANSTKSTYTYYISIADDTWGTASGTLGIAVNDRYDANSSTDAGSTFDSAMTVAAGSYTGYLSATDIDDYYTISGVAGTISAKVTPAQTGTPSVTIYDANRAELVNEWASNGGQIVTATGEISTNQKVYIKVSCEYSSDCLDPASVYALVITNGTSAIVPDTQEPEVPDIVVVEPYVDITTIDPIVPTGKGAEIDAVVNPPLVKTFGENVVVREVVNDRIVYVVKDPVKASDLESIKAAMEALGYKTKSITTDTLVMQKGFKEITFQRLEGSNQITVSQSSSTNTILLWAGVGVLGLILIVLVILLVVKMKKSSTPKKEEKSAETVEPVTTEAPVETVEPAKVEKKE